MAFFEGNNMTGGYGNGPDIINSCSVNVEKGEIVSILGPNGAGKSTAISLKKGPVPICPPNKKVKNFFNKIGTTVEIKNEKLSINFWSTSGMMASYYELLKVMSGWLVKRGIKRSDAQKYITTLFLALSEDAVINSKKELKYLVKESQTPKGLNEQGLKEMNKKAVYKSLINTLNGIHKRLNK